MAYATGALAALLVVAFAYNVLSAVVAVSFGRRVRGHRAEPAHECPGVSILVPLEGDEPGLFDNLAAYCRLRYPGPVQLVVGSIDPADAALGLARRVADRHGDADVAIVGGARIVGPNRKASLLAALGTHARHPIVAALDSDVRVAPDYLSRVVPALLQPGVGLVSCVYRGSGASTLARAYERLCINTDFCPSVMVAAALGRRDIALGASILLRADTLARIGGFAAVADHLADDHRIGELVAAGGERIALAPCVVESDPNPATIGAALRHQVRWARTVRACAPVGYGATIVTHGTTFIACALALRSPLSVPVAAAMLSRVGAAAAGVWALGARIDWTMALLPIRDLVATGVWLASFASDRVEWRGRHYRVGREGHLRLADLPPAILETVERDVAVEHTRGAA
ncbi:MAG TPA: bacteriohopanetetrol glucosamine biosynthesis glycosyltransferase HpnI [Candidatus Binatia bacterium]|jgi:ceramide glucosyltransferase